MCDQIDGFVKFGYLLRLKYSQLYHKFAKYLIKAQFFVQYDLKICQRVQEFSKSGQTECERFKNSF